MELPRSHTTPAATLIQQPVPAPSGDVKDWSVEDIAKWLESKGVTKYSCDWLTEHRNGDYLLGLSADIRQCDLNTEGYGIRKRILEVVDELRREATKKPDGPFPEEGGRREEKPPINAPWLADLHKRLWGREDLFSQVFHAVDLTKEDFIELQSELHDLNPSRNHESYVATGKNILETKVDFLRSRTATHPLIINTDSLVPKVVFDEPRIPAGAMDVDVDSDDSIDDEDATNDEDANGDEEAKDEADESEFDDDGSYIVQDAAELSHGPTPVFPCTIRYMDLTCLNLPSFTRVSQILLIRDEWDEVIDIFNKGRRGIRGGAVWTGEPGIGKTALLYFILVVCLIKAQPFVFQNISGTVYTIGDEVLQSSGGVVKVPGADVLALVDGDSKICQPDDSLLSALNLRILLISSPRSHKDRRWLTQNIQDEDASYVVGPWQWKEFSITSIFLSDLDITLCRLEQAVKFCGFNPRPVFLAVRSPNALAKAEKKIRYAIVCCADIERAIAKVVGDLPVPHCAFMMYPGDETRSLVMCLVKPVSDWALDVVVETLESRCAGAAYELYQRLDGYWPASAFRAQLWEYKVQRYLCSSNLPSFRIQCLEDGDSSTMEWNPLKDMLTFDFGPSKGMMSENFESFDPIVYEPKKPLVNIQVTENHDHPIRTELLSAFDAVLKPLRSLVSQPWIILFVVPIPMQTTFKKQKSDSNVWEKKTKQYVLGLDKYDVFHCSSERFSR